jgi:hypothetical protein
MTAPLWLPGIPYIRSDNNGGSMLGADAYFTWHTYECGYDVSASSGARGLITQGTEVHFCFNPVTGELVQILPANVAGRGLVNLSGGVQTNRQGRVNLQVEVIGRASRPWTQDITDAGRRALAKLIAFADLWGIPRTHPNGDQGPIDKYAPTNRSVTGWNGPGGYFCHAQVPENTHWDHGAVKFSDLWAIADAINNPEVDMPLTDDDIRRIWAYKNPDPDVSKNKDAYAWLREGSQPIDVPALAAAIAAALPDDTVVSDQQLQDALRTVFGSLDNQPSA